MSLSQSSMKKYISIYLDLTVLVRRCLKMIKLSNKSILLMFRDQDTKIWDFQERIHHSQNIRVASWLGLISNLKQVIYYRRTGRRVIDWASSMSFNPEAYFGSGSHLLNLVRAEVTATIAVGLHFKYIKEIYSTWMLQRVSSFTLPLKVFHRWEKIFNIIWVPPSLLSQIIRSSSNICSHYYISTKQK